MFDWLAPAAQYCQWYCTILLNFPTNFISGFYFSKNDVNPGSIVMSELRNASNLISESYVASSVDLGPTRFGSACHAVSGYEYRYNHCHKSKIENYPQVILSGYFTLPPFYHPHSSINSTHDMPSRSSNQVTIERDNTRLEKPLLVFIIEHWFLFLWNRNHASMVYNLSGANK